MTGVAIVTGAAQGIGKETAAEIHARGGKAHAVVADVGVEEDVRRMGTETAETFAASTCSSTTRWCTTTTFQAHQPWHAQNHVVHPDAVR